MAEVNRLTYRYPWLDALNKMGEEPDVMGDFSLNYMWVDEPTPKAPPKAKPKAASQNLVPQSLGSAAVSSHEASVQRDNAPPDYGTSPTPNKRTSHH